MKNHMLILASILLLLILSPTITVWASVSPDSSILIYGRVVDAYTGHPIFNATIIVWDLNTLAIPKPGVGIYFTNENGEYNISGSYLKEGHTYYVIALKRSSTEKTAEIEYVPVIKKNIGLEYGERKNISFSLIPGAVIEMTDTPYIVQSSSPEVLRYVIKVLPKEEISIPFVDEYGDSSDAWWLRLGRKIVVIPANMPVVLETKVWYFTGGVGRFVESEVFFIYNGSSPFQLSQGELYRCSLSEYGLKGSLNFLKSKLLLEVSNQVDKAQDDGFVVFDERRLLTSMQNEIIRSETLLANVKTPEDYLKIWTNLREIFGTLNFISSTLESKRLIATTNAVYLSAVMAAFSITLAFFLFEKKKEKMVSSGIIFIVYLFLLYLFHPGAHIIIKENFNLFLESAGISFAGISLLVFGVPRVWKERTVEGRVSWRSAITIIFSMGKRQIKRRKIRGFFTILSITILVLAFTSLTSFGTVFGIVSKEIGSNAPSDGVIVKRMMNRTSLLFSPLGSSNPGAVSKLIETISKLVGIENSAPRLKNLPRASPLIRLVNPKEGKNWFIYGVMAIDPVNESAYTGLQGIIKGSYLSESGSNEVLISQSIANALRVRIGDNITLEVLGTNVLANFIVKGFMDDDGYNALLDMDGTLFGPLRIEDGTVRTCNSTESLIMNLKSAENLQSLVNAKLPGKASQIFVLSDIVFQPKDYGNINSMVKSLIFTFNYDVYVSQQRRITYYYIGSYLEAKGTLELLIPLVMVGLNVGTVMLNSVYERRKEIRTLSMMGLNPTHIGLIFVTEAVILGMVGGSLGYVVGLGFYRIMNLFGQNLMIREKLEWWWSAIGFAIAMTASVLSSIRPATLAISTYTPSKIRKIKHPEKEVKVREEEIFKIYQARELSMPVKVKSNEVLFFISFCLDRLSDLRTGFIERVENLEETPEIEDVRGNLSRTIKFDYVFIISDQKRRTKNTLLLTKSPKEDYYRVRLISEPAVPGLPESVIERTTELVHKIVLDWVKERERIVTGI